MRDVPTFHAFFHAVHRGRTPFPWQERLAERVAQSGWPASIGVPTGLGKTTCIDIAVWALAAQAWRPSGQRSAATRIWYVVDRRLLVDGAYEHGERLAQLLLRPESLTEEWPDATRGDVEALAHVGAALTSIARLGTKRSPLHVVRLRGGAAIGQRSPDPSQPTLLFSTVAMYGSRLLFRGYGSSRLMRSVDAALAGTDSLVLLDEAHLARPLLRLSETAARCDVGGPETLLPLGRSRPQLVSLTATGDENGERFDLDDADLANAIVARRVSAAKPTTLVATTKKGMVRALAEQAERLIAASPHGACIVFCNTVTVARATRDALLGSVARMKSPPTVVLLTGRMRNREAAAAIERVLDPTNGAPAGRSRATRERQLIVVATQTLEVGADLDFDALVTESAGARALIQRFGRLNRLGTCPEPAAVICHPEHAPEQPPYGNDPTSVWARLSEATGSLDLAPERIGAIMGKPDDRPARVGQLLPAHLWEYAKTTCPEPDEAPAELFFAGFGDDVRRVSVCWRCHLPVSGNDDDASTAVLHPAVRDHEVVEVPIADVRRFLDETSHTVVHRLADDRVSVELVAASSLRPGDTLVLSVDAGGYDESGWNPQATESVLDVSALDQRVLWLDDVGLAAMTGADRAAIGPIQQAVARLQPSDKQDLDVDEVAATVTEICAALDEFTGHPWLKPAEWEEYRASFNQCSAPTLLSDGSWALFGEVAGRRSEPVDVRADAFDGLSFDVRSALLREHLQAVGNVARGVAEHLGLAAEVASAVGRAGAWHDLGKADPRFQRLLDPHGEHDEPLAKSEAGVTSGSRAAAGWPRGGRHEALSGRLLQQWFETASPGCAERDLILHLVLSHHGHGRPLVPAPEDSAPPLISAEIEGTTVRAVGDLSVVDWDQPRRFHGLCVRYGYWGLALLEAVVRQSDHAASRAQDDSEAVVA